jgi:hypothetical protein
MISNADVLKLKIIPELLGEKYQNLINLIYSQRGVSPKKFTLIRNQLKDLVVNNNDEETVIKEVEIIELLLANSLQRYSDTKPTSLFIKTALALIVIIFLATSVIKPVVAQTSPQAELWYESALGYVQTFYQWIEVINGAMKTINGGIQYMIKQADNNATAMLDLQAENYNKSQVARGTIAEKTLTYMESQRKAWNRLGNTSGGSVCIGDSAYGGYMGLRILDAEWADEVGMDAQKRELLNGSKSQTSSNGKKVAQLSGILDSSNSTVDEKNLAKRSLTVIPDGKTIVKGSKEEASAKTAIELFTGTPPTLGKGSFKALAKSEMGKEYLGGSVTRHVRRDTAVKSVVAETARNVGDSDTYDMVLSNAEAMLEPPEKTGDEPSQYNERNAMLARSVVNYMKGNFPDGVMSSNDTLKFMTDLRMSSEYSEFIRSSGPVPTPLIRDVIHNQIVGMAQRARQIEIQERSLSILSSILLEIQDDPERVRELASQRRRALGSDR